MRAFAFITYAALAVSAALMVWLIVRHKRELAIENAQDVLTYFNEPHIPRWERRAFYASLLVFVAAVVAAAMRPYG